MEFIKGGDPILGESVFLYGKVIHAMTQTPETDVECLDLICVSTTASSEGNTHGYTGCFGKILTTFTLSPYPAPNSNKCYERKEKIQVRVTNNIKGTNGEQCTKLVGGVHASFVSQTEVKIGTNDEYSYYIPQQYGYDATYGGKLDTVSVASANPSVPLREVLCLTVFHPAGDIYIELRNSSTDYYGKKIEQTTFGEVRQMITVFPTRPLADGVIGEFTTIPPEGVLPEHDGHVALKIIRKDLLPGWAKFNPQCQKDPMREIYKLQFIQEKIKSDTENDPGAKVIVNLLEAFEDNNYVMYVMPYYNGEKLDAFLFSTLTDDVLKNTTKKLCLATVFLNKHGISNLDLSYENVLCHTHGAANMDPDNFRIAITGLGKASLVPQNAMLQGSPIDFANQNLNGLKKEKRGKAMYYAPEIWTNFTPQAVHSIDCFRLNTYHVGINLVLMTTGDLFLAGLKSGKYTPDMLLLRRAITKTYPHSCDEIMEVLEQLLVADPNKRKPLEEVLTLRWFK